MGSKGDYMRGAWTRTCPQCGGTMIAGKMERHGVVIGEFWLCFKCGLMIGRSDNENNAS